MPIGRKIEGELPSHHWLYLVATRYRLVVYLALLLAALLLIARSQ